MSVATKPKTQRRTMPDAMEVELFKDLRRTLPKACHYDRNGNLLWHYVRIPEMLIYGGAPTLCGCWLKDDPKHTVYRSSRNEGLRNYSVLDARSCTGTSSRRVRDGR